MFMLMVMGASSESLLEAGSHAHPSISPGGDPRENVLSTHDGMQLFLGKSGREPGMLSKTNSLVVSQSWRAGASALPTSSVLVLCSAASAHHATWWMLKSSAKMEFLWGWNWSRNSIFFCLDFA